MENMGTHMSLRIAIHAFSIISIEQRKRRDALESKDDKLQIAVGLKAEYGYVVSIHTHGSSCR